LNGAGCISRYKSERMGLKKYDFERLISYFFALVFDEKSK
jgi:hypothetical protein